VALLDATPEAPPDHRPLTYPALAAPSVLRGFPLVEGVVRVAPARSPEEYYVVACARGASGSAKLPRTSPHLRFNARLTERPPTSPPSRLTSSGALPILDTLHVSAFPDRGGVSHGRHSLPTVAASLRPAANTALLVNNSLLGVRGGVSQDDSMAHADDDGPNVDDAVSIPLGRSAYFRSTGITGGASGGRSYFINESERCVRASQ